jgi:hypothetical protein
MGLGNGDRRHPALVRVSEQFLNPVRPDAALLYRKAEVQRKGKVFFGKVEVLAGDTGELVDAALIVLRD